MSKKDYSNLNSGKVSRNHSNESNAGAFNVNLNNSTSNSNANISSHLCVNKQYKICDVSLATWQNIIKNNSLVSRLILEHSTKFKHNGGRIEKSRFYI